MVLVSVFVLLFGCDSSRVDTTEEVPASIEPGGPCSEGPDFWYCEDGEAYLCTTLDEEATWEHADCDSVGSGDSGDSDTGGCCGRCENGYTGPNLALTMCD